MILEFYLCECESLSKDPRLLFRCLDWPLPELPEVGWTITFRFPNPIVDGKEISKTGTITRTQREREDYEMVWVNMVTFADVLRENPELRARNWKQISKNLGLD